MNTINNILGIKFEDGYYWTGLYYKGNTSLIGSKTYRGILWTILMGRW